MGDKIFPGGTGVTTRSASELVSDDMVLMGTSDAATESAVAYETKYSSIKTAIKSEFWEVGDVMPVAGDTSSALWLMLNGDSVGSAASAADEADDGYEELFEFLWDTYDNTDCPVSSGRGASAAADWAADKTIDLPSMDSINSTDLIGLMIYAGAGSGNSGFGGGK